KRATRRAVAARVESGRPAMAEFTKITVSWVLVTLTLIPGSLNSCTRPRCNVWSEAMVFFASSSVAQLVERRAAAANNRDGRTIPQEHMEASGLRGVESQEWGRHGRRSCGIRTPAAEQSIKILSRFRRVSSLLALMTQ